MEIVPSLAVLPDPVFELIVFDLDALRAAICAVGEFDLAARDELAEALHRQEAEGRLIVRLDLSQVTFLDCSCLGVVVASHHRFLNRHGLLVLTGVDGPVARVLHVTRLDETLFVIPEHEDLFGGVLVARANPVKVPEQRLASAPSFDSLLADADRAGGDAKAPNHLAV